LLENEYLPITLDDFMTHSFVEVLLQGWTLSIDDLEDYARFLRESLCGEDDVNCEKNVYDHVWQVVKLLIYAKENVSVRSVWVPSN